MCGIAGIINLHRHPADESIIKKMMQCMAHRGPDATGFFVKDEVGLGHGRLSIIDLSETNNQPLWDHTNRYALIFNGEVYNFRDVKGKLGQYPFRTAGDSEVILAAYAKWGAECLSHLIGMFAFAIWDEVDRTLFIARDRLGVKPLYYSCGSDYFSFASEVRPFIHSRLVKPRINATAVYEFLHYQSVSSPYSILEDVHQLEAGHYLIVKDGRIQTKQYWDITKSTTDRDVNDELTVKKSVRELMLKSVERRLISDVPLGAFLSGGIDSSAIVGLMAACTNNVNTFTVGFSEKQFDESSFAQIIAKKFNTRHTEVQMDPAVFLDELVNALNSMDSPSGDGINTYVVSKAIKKSGLTVALSGLGGDELFAGYPLFRQFVSLNQRSGAWNISRPFRKVAAGLIAAGSNVRNDRIRQMLETTGSSIAEFYPISRQIISPRQIKRVLKLGLPEETVVEKQLRSKLSDIEKYPLLSQVTIAELSGYTQNTLLKDTDQMSMAVSLEVREPFFDHELIEYVLNIPDRFKYPVTPKKLLVESLEGLLPNEIVSRPKQGFVFPWAVWMKKELKAFCEEHLNEFAAHAFVEPATVMQKWEKFQRGDKSIRWQELWLFIILGYWLKRNSVG